MPPDHMDQLYNARNFLVRYVHRQRLGAIAAQVPSRGMRVLDAGCGEGHLLGTLQKRYPGNHYLGIDVTEVALTRARARVPEATYQLGNITTLNVEDDSMDVVIATEVLEHIPGCEAALVELQRVLRPGGRLIVTFPNEPLWTVSRFLLRRDPVKVPDHVNSFTPRRMAQLAKWPVVVRRSLPFPLPFFCSLGCLMVLQKP